MSTPFPGPILGGSAERIVSTNLASVRERTRGVSMQQRFALAGLVLAAVMVAVLYQVLSNNIAELENKRQASQEQARARHACAMMQARLERDQCFASLIEPSIDKLAAPVDEPPPNTVLAGR